MSYLKYDDLTPMPFGVHKRNLMQDVPAQYLHWLYYNGLFGEKGLAIKEYIEGAWSALKQETPDLLWERKK